MKLQHRKGLKLGKTYFDKIVFEGFLGQISLPNGPKIKFLSFIIAHKIKFSIKNFFSKCDQIRRKLRFGHIYWRNP